jgi:hypothetical protein
VTEVCHRGDIVSYGGETFQALQDTGKTPSPGHPHWQLLACRGRDAVSPRVCGVFNAHKSYAAFDVVEHDGNSYIAVRDLNPGTIPGEDEGSWQLLARHGGRGSIGKTGARGQKGEQGSSGKAAPKTIDWVIDKTHYTAHPILSDGSRGPKLDLRPLFEQLLIETTAATE